GRRSGPGQGRPVPAPVGAALRRRRADRADRRRLAGVASVFAQERTAMKPSTQAAGLLRDVCDNPGDDTPRLEYADWLEDNGAARRNRPAPRRTVSARPGSAHEERLRLAQRIA